MINRIIGAVVRAFCVAFAVLYPTLVVASSTNQGNTVGVFLALIAGVLTFSEYVSRAPSFIEFRWAPPFNRIRFAALFACVLFFSGIFLSSNYESVLFEISLSVATIFGHLSDFVYSPVRLIILMLPSEAAPELIDTVRIAAGFGSVLAALCVMAFAVFIYVLNWPSNSGAFNVWMNLPLFDPVQGKDILELMERDARVNLMLGALMPFLIPAVVKLATPLISTALLQEPQALVWILIAWVLIPTSLLMRGMAMMRVCQMIALKRQQRDNDDRFVAA